MVWRESGGWMALNCPWSAIRGGRRGSWGGRARRQEGAVLDGLALPDLEVVVLEPGVLLAPPVERLRVMARFQAQATRRSSLFSAAAAAFDVLRLTDRSHISHPNWRSDDEMRACAFTHLSSDVVAVADLLLQLLLEAACHTRGNLVSSGGA